MSRGMRRVVRKVMIIFENYVTVISLCIVLEGERAHHRHRDDGHHNSCAPNVTVVAALALLFMGGSALSGMKPGVLFLFALMSVAAAATLPWRRNDERDVYTGGRRWLLS